MQPIGRNIRHFCILFVFIWFFPVQLFTQVTDNQIKAGYLFNYLKNFTWERENKIDTFRVGIYGGDKELVDVFKSMEQLTAKNKPIHISRFNSLSEITYTHILYVSGERNIFIKDIYDLLKARNTLIVTDRCEYKRYVMINFIYDENSKILFEINSQNLQESNFQVSPRLILLGGNEIDVRKLYIETEKSLSTEKEKVESFEKELSLKKEEISKMNTKLNKYYNEIESLQLKISSQKNELNTLSIRSHEQKVDLEKKSIILSNQKNEILSREKKIFEKDQEISAKQKEIDNYSSVLNAQKSEIDKRQATINEQGKTLNTQLEKIRTQRNFLYMLVTLVLLAIILAFVIYRNYSINRARNLELTEKNEKIQTQSEELYQQTEQLRSLNKELINKKNKLEEALIKLKNTQTQLVESEKMVILGQLTSGIAHEINNPINFINTGIEYLKTAFDQIVTLLKKYEELNTYNVKDRLDIIASYKYDINYNSLIADINQIIKDIKSGVFRTIEIVKSLRTFSRLDESDLKPIDLHKSIDSTLVILKNKFINRIDIEKNYGTIPYIECYPGKINQLLLNILVNAIQAIKKDGKISIKTSLVTKDDTQYVEISIKDTGMGMPDHIKKKIFEPFFTTKEAGEGTGLGLSISQNIVETHHGSITVESILNEGSEFTILLPIEFKKKNKSIIFEEK
jgi:signal transduction histidine kinase